MTEGTDFSDLRHTAEPNITLPSGKVPQIEPLPQGWVTEPGGFPSFGKKNAVRGWILLPIVDAFGALC